MTRTLLPCPFFSCQQKFKEKYGDGMFALLLGLRLVHQGLHQGSIHPSTTPLVATRSIASGTSTGIDREMTLSEALPGVLQAYDDLETKYEHLGEQQSVLI